jgi:hypothetical protein
MKKLILCALLLLVLYPFGLGAQTSCSEQLRVAQRRYDEGLLDDIPKLLSGCLENGFSKEEKKNAYKLLIQTYLYSDETVKADETMVAFLKEFPEYKIAINDPKEFVLLHKSYRTEPIMNIELVGGGNISLPKVSEYFGVENLSNETANYEALFGVNVGANYVDRLYQDFDFSAGVLFRFQKYGYTNNVYSHTEVLATFTELQIGVPISARYNFKVYGVRGQVFLGVEPSYRLSTSVDFSRIVSGVPDPFTGTVSLNEMRKKFDINPILGVGGFFNIGSAKFKANAKLRFATISATTNELRYSRPDLVEKFYYIDDNILVHELSLSVAYIISIYNPKKIH